MATLTTPSYIGEDLKALPAMGRAAVPVPLEVAKDIWAAAESRSFVMTHGTRADMPAGGREFLFLTSEPEAAWVKEGGRKPLGVHTFGTRTFKPYKAALIESFSDEFRRDRATQYNMLKPRLAAALGRLFDRAVLLGANLPDPSMSNLGSVTEVAIPLAPNTDPLTEANFLSIMAASTSTDAAWVFSRKAQIGLYSARWQPTGSTTGERLFVPEIGRAPVMGSILGSPVLVSEEVADASVRAVQPADSTNKSDAGYTVVADANGNAVAPAGYQDGDRVGLYGPLADIGWGYVEGITMEEYDGPIYKADGSLVHAGRQDNLTSVIVEFEIGSLIRDTSQFVGITADTTTGP